MIRFVTSCTALMLLAVTTLHAQVVKVELKQTSPGHYQLIRGGQPFFIKGAGGDGDKQLMANLGGNAFRTWVSAVVPKSCLMKHRSSDSPSPSDFGLDMNVTALTIPIKIHSKNRPPWCAMRWRVTKTIRRF